MLNREDVLPPEEKQWQEIDESKLTLAERCVYRNRRRALELSRKGSSPKEIFRMTGISHAALVRLQKRGTTQNPETGISYGYEVLIPRSKIKKFIR